MESTKPLPIPNDLTQPFWDAAREGRLLVQHCVTCERRQFYPRGHCLHCGERTVAWTDAAGTGVVHTYTVTHRSDAPGFADAGPYVLAIVATDEGVRMAGNVVGVDPEAVAVGMPVEVVFERLTDELSLPQWTPRAEART